MTIEERLEAVERELAHQNEMRGLREINERLATSQVNRIEAQSAETRKALPKLEENIQQMRDSLTVASAQTLRHETRLKEHQQWVEDMERAFTRMAARDEIHSARMEELDEKITQIAAAQLFTEEKLQGLIDALRRGSNGHS